MDEELNRTEFDGAFCKKFKLLVDGFFHFFAKRRKSIEKVIHQKKNRGQRTSKIVKSRKSSSNVHLLGLLIRKSIYALGVLPG